jgi:hypothetical protein
MRRPLNHPRGLHVFGESLEEPAEALDTPLLPVLPASVEMVGDSVEVAGSGAGNRAASPAGYPPSFLCPITQEPMNDPVIALDGHSYECAAIRHWFREHQTSPVTNERLRSTLLLRNFALRNAMAEWQALALQSGAEDTPTELVASSGDEDATQYGVALIDFQQADAWAAALGGADDGSGAVALNPSSVPWRQWNSNFLKLAAGVGVLLLTLLGVGVFVSAGGQFPPANQRRENITDS